MRTIQIERENEHYIDITYPDAVCFANNHNSIVIESATEFEYVDVTILTKSVRAYLMGGDADIVLTSLLKERFVNTRNRHYNATITVKTNTNVQLLSFTTLVINGWIAPFDRVYDFGAYNNQGNNNERVVRWFANYPFSVSLLVLSGTNVFRRVDATEYSSVSLPNGINDVTIQGENNLIVYKLQRGTPTSNFDDTCNYPFKKLTEQDEVVIIKRDNSKFGYYLRWIDNYGYYQYWLFDKGSETSSKSSSSNNRTGYKVLNGMQLKYEEPISVTRNKKYKCAACNINKQEFDYVSSVNEGRSAELYVGKDKSGSAIWMPVIVSTSDIQYDAKKALQTIEIEFTIKEIDEIL